MNYDHTIGILSQEINKVGGELFADAVLRLKAKEDESAEKAIHVQDLASSLFGGVFEGKSDKEDRFKELVSAIMLLKEAEKEDKSE